MARDSGLRRTTILLDVEAEAAARELATKYGSNTSEAIRRSIVNNREAEFGLSESQRLRRTNILNHLFDLFAGHDAADEVRRLKEEDEGF